MRSIILGEYYRHKNSPNYAWAKVIEVLKPKQYPNTLTCIVVKCEWSKNKGDKTGLIKHFKLKDLIKP